MKSKFDAAMPSNNGSAKGVDLIAIRYFNMENVRTLKVLTLDNII